jgi:energy-converting hydrogenase Eha subunit A
MHRFLFSAMIGCLLSSILSAQTFVDDDFLDLDFVDEDSAVVYYGRVGAGFSAVSSDLRTNIIAQTFNAKFSERPSSDNPTNQIANGISLHASLFRKLNRVLAFGAGLNLSPVISIVPEEQVFTPPPRFGAEVIVRSTNAFSQILSADAIGELRFKIIIFDLGFGVQLQRLGDIITTTTYTSLPIPTVSTESRERLAWVLSPTAFFALGVDFFLGQSFGIIPMYKSFLWRFGGEMGYGYSFMLVLRTNF